MKKIFLLLSLLLLSVSLPAAEAQEEFVFRRNTDVGLFNAESACFQCSVQPYRPYLHLFPSEIPVRGLNFSFYSAQRSMKGITLALIASEPTSSGAAMAIFNNSDVFSGLSFSVLSWQRVMNGLSLGIINIAEKAGHDCQMGLVNVSHSAFQIGLVNYNTNGFVKVFPFINFSVEHKPRY